MKEKKDKLREKEREEKQLEREERQAQAESEKEIIKLVGIAAKGKLSVLSSPDPVFRPSLPSYKDEEDTATYLTRFERVAEMLVLLRDTFAICLGCLLTGKAAELYRIHH